LRTRDINTFADIFVRDLGSLAVSATNAICTVSRMRRELSREPKIGPRQSGGKRRAKVRKKGYKKKLIKTRATW
jgi:hypothetical protein